MSPWCASWAYRRSPSKTVAGTSAHGVQLGALPGSLNQPRAVAVVPGFGLAISDELENSILLAHGP